MTPESGIMERRHQRHVSRLRRPFPIPNPPARLASLAAIFPIWPCFLPFSPSTEPGPRLAGGVLLKGDPYPWVSLQNEVFLNQILLNRVPLLLRLCFGSLPGLFSNFRPFFPPVLRRPKYEEQRKGYYFKTWSERGRKRIHFIYEIIWGKGVESVCKSFALRSTRFLAWRNKRLLPYQKKRQGLPHPSLAFAFMQLLLDARSMTHDPPTHPPTQLDNLVPLTVASENVSQSDYKNLNSMLCSSLAWAPRSCARRTMKQE